ncbi:hypothetical protein BGZ58_011154 [Dissophora ornata]|nr:hypothetical protein BGZ58_011154 [Dissophora ornata]
MNNLLPLHSIMSTYEGSRSSWFMRVSGQENKDNERKQQYRILDDKEQELDTYLLAPHGREIVFNPPKGKSLAAHQISPPSKSFPTCFAKAVVGLQSRCTRPYCENLIGGSDLTESLRAKVLDILSPSMIRFQTTDPNIVHPPSGQNVAIVSQDNLTVVEGESAPRSRIQVALLGRYGNTSIPNANALELSLLARGFAVKTIHFDRPSEISLPQAAQLFRNQSILVAPQGDALGYSTWMAPGTVVVSILPRFTRSSKIYTDRMMAFGKRFFAWDCQDDSCVQPDRDLAHECIEAIQDSYEQQGISAQDFEAFANMKQDFRQRSTAWKAISDCYTRDVSRRINVEELTTLIEGLAKDFSFNAPNEKAKDVIGGAKSAHRRDLGDDAEDEDDLELETTNTEDILFVETEDQDDDLDKEETVRIQGDDGEPSDNNNDSDEDEGDSSENSNDSDDDEGEPSENNNDLDEGEEEPSESNNDTDEDEDVNVHEYDEQNRNETTQEAPATSSTGVKTSSSSSSRPAQPVSVQPLSSTFELQYQAAQPIFDFAEFCKRGRCCGSAKISEKEVIGSTGGKGLTPCATSMSAIVFGAKGVWGLTDELASIKESQSLVWQVDLGRN